MVLDRNRVSPAKRRDPALEVATSDFIKEIAAVGLEQWLIKTVCAPCLELTPHWIHPNALSMANLFVNWATLGLAIFSESEQDLERCLMLHVLAGFGMLVSMILDCLDGMQARRTGTCSKLGEVLDHGLDAISVPVSVATIGFGLHMFTHSWVIICLGMVLSVCVYDAQLVLYHHSGQFIHPDVTTGTEGQFGLAVTHVAFGIWEYLLLKNGLGMSWHVVGTQIYGLGVIVVSCKVIWFYSVRLQPLKCLSPFFFFMCYMMAAMVLFSQEYVDSFGFVILVTMTTFRICGTFVITTCVKQDFKGYDTGCAVMLGLALLDASHLISVDSICDQIGIAHNQPWLKKDMMLLVGYMTWVVTRNLHLLGRHFDSLQRK